MGGGPYISMHLLLKAVRVVWDISLKKVPAIREYMGELNSNSMVKAITVPDGVGSKCHRL